MTDMLSFKKSLEKSSKTAVEAINNIRTVAGLRCEERVIGEYARALQGANSTAYNHFDIFFHPVSGIRGTVKLRLEAFMEVSLINCSINFISLTSYPF